MVWGYEQAGAGYGFIHVPRGGCTRVRGKLHIGTPSGVVQDALAPA